MEKIEELYAKLEFEKSYSKELKQKIEVLERQVNFYENNLQNLMVSMKPYLKKLGLKIQ